MSPRPERQDSEIAALDSESYKPVESQSNMNSPTKLAAEGSPMSLLDTVKLQLQNIIHIPEILINAVSPAHMSSRMKNHRGSMTLEGLTLGLHKVEPEDLSSPLPKEGEQRINPVNFLKVGDNTHDYNSAGG